MKKCVVCLFLCFFVMTGAFAQDLAYTPTDDHIFSFGRIPADFAASVAQHGGQVVRLHHQIGVAVATGLSDEDAEAIANGKSFARDLSVQWLPELDEMEWDLANMGNGATQGHDPTDALFFPIQWDMQIIDADDAWNAGFQGSPNVTVAILDTGIDPFHQDMVGLVLE